MGLPEELHRLVRRQAGLVTRAQLVAAGVPQSTVHHRVAVGRWQCLLPGVYATWSGPVTGDGRLRAAMLWAGPAVACTGVTALRLYGAAYLPSHAPLHLVVPQRRQLTAPRTVAGERLRLTRSDRWPELLPVQAGLRCMPAARAVGDAVRGWPDLRRVRAVALSAVQRGLATAAELAAECEAGPQHGSGLLRLAVADAFANVWSSPEAEFRELVRSSAVLPEPRWNCPITDAGGRIVAYGDAVVEEVKLVVEIDSAEHHAGAQQWRRTLERHNRLSALGYTVLHLTPSSMRADRRAALRDVEATYLRLRQRPRTA